MTVAVIARAALTIAPEAHWQSIEPLWRRSTSNACRSGAVGCSRLGCAHCHTLDNPNDKPKQSSNGRIQKNICENAHADDGVSTHSCSCPLVAISHIPLGQRKEPLSPAMYT